MTRTHTQASSWGLTLGALGVVFGDIGTSPLYAFRECFHHSHGIAVLPANVMGVLSLIVWSLVLVVTLKYLMFVMRADNKGEGGILALTTLALRAKKSGSAREATIVALGLFGAALLYGDGMITPAISVLSAVEGLKIATPVLEPYVVPITVVILVGLFTIQSHGTGRLGKFLGPIMLMWFGTIAILGIRGIFNAPEVLSAVSPLHALRFFAENSTRSIVVLGSVFLAVTGGEALYADMGHFGRGPIKTGWLYVAFPALVLQYFGQGALLLQTPEAIENPFFRLAPAGALYPLVALSTAATVIASQAMLTGAFSMSHQATQLGFLPHLEVQHTSAAEAGQIYVPAANWLMLAGTLWIVLEFRSSSALAAAYGIAVTMTMVITTILTYQVARDSWHWSLPAAGIVTLVFLIPDLFFLTANALKIGNGGWLPIVIAAGVYLVMRTWRDGRALLAKRLAEVAVPWEKFEDDYLRKGITRVPGTAVFMTPTPNSVPFPLIQNVQHNHVLHERVILLTVRTDNVPHVGVGQRFTMEELRDGIYRIDVRYGFMDKPNIPPVVMRSGLVKSKDDLTYFLGRRTVLATSTPGMALWRERLFAFLSRESQTAGSYFHIPSKQTVELGSVVDL